MTSQELQDGLRVFENDAIELLRRSKREGRGPHGLTIRAERARWRNARQLVKQYVQERRVLVRPK